MWPSGTTLHEKLSGDVEDLRRTTPFIMDTGVTVWGERQEERKYECVSIDIWYTISDDCTMGLTYMQTYTSQTIGKIMMCNANKIFSQIIKDKLCLFKLLCISFQTLPQFCLFVFLILFAKSWTKVYNITSLI